MTSPSSPASKDLPAASTSTIATAGGTGSETVTVSVRDADGVEVARADGVAGALTIADVVLWQPGAAYLYSLTAEVRDGGRLLDSYTLPVGVRTVEVRGMEFLINGEPFYFTGFGMHEDHVAIGKGHEQRPDRPRFPAPGLGRRELVPHLALPVRRRGHGVRRPPRHRRDRRNRRRRAQPRDGGAVFGGIAKKTFADGGVDANTAANHRAGDLASSSPATRTTRPS